MNSPFALSTRSTASIMTQVMLALIPGTFVMMWLLGPGIWINLAVVVLTATLCEALVLKLRHKPIGFTLADGSIVLAAWLLALCLPPTLPISHLILAAVAMTVLGKHVYGGLGQNPFNPAMVAYAILLISFPKAMTLWFDPSRLIDWPNTSSLLTWWQLKWNPAVITAHWDSITQATPLDRLRTAARPGHTLDLNTLARAPWWEINTAWFLGGLFLLIRGIIRWHIPVAVLGTAVAAHFIHSFLYPDTAIPIGSAVMYGGLIFGAFFIATDPVTAPSSVRARLCYGMGIGLLTVILRTSSNYPEGVAFAVLLMNAVAPLLDRLFVMDRRL